MRIALVVNPEAGRGSGLEAADAAQPVLEAAGWRVARMLTEHDGHARELAAQACRDGLDGVFACGGDGTLSQVMNSLAGTRLVGGLIPTGTGNDFARTVGLSSDPVRAARQATVGREARIDMLEVEGERECVLNVLNVGFDARVAERTNKQKHWATGLPAYLTAVAQELVSHRSIDVMLRVDGEEWEGRALAIVVANGRCYGGGMRIAPQADITDGLLDVVLIRYVGRLAFVSSFAHVLRGTHTGHPAVLVWRAAEVRIETEEPAQVVFDGDIQCETPLAVRVAPRKARFWMPGALAPVSQELILQPSVE